MMNSEMKVDDVIAQFGSDEAKTVVFKSETFAFVKYEFEGKTRYFCLYVKGDRWRALQIGDFEASIMERVPELVKA